MAEKEDLNPRAGYPTYSLAGDVRTRLTAWDTALLKGIEKE